MRIKIKRGDKVRVISGSNKGSEGEIISINSDTNKAIVEGVNIVKKHNKPSAQNPQGGISEKEAPIHISNLSLITPEGKTTRVGFRYEEGDKVRYSKKTNEVI
ncbi:50S ribosomal protein L24 [Bacteroidetes bacterium SCGC AAA795-G10]|nr:50S ribosomal protein L24 [Bacteroidetes bacterium SCGC AAA795-G10]